jgi:hypothetical protein
MFNLSQGLQQPYMQSGYGAQTVLNQLLGIAPQTAAGNTPTAAKEPDVQIGNATLPAGTTTRLTRSDRSGTYGDVIDASGQVIGTISPGGKAGIFRSNGRTPATQATTPANTAPNGGANVAGGGSTLTSDGVQQGLQTGPSTGTPLSNMNGVSGTGLPAGYLTQQFGRQQFLDNVDPGYGFQLQQGNTALENRLSAGGSTLGGAGLRALAGYNQDYASTGYNNAFNRFETQQGNIFQRLSDVANRGQNAAAGVGQNAITTGSNIGANTVGAGNARAAADVATGNAIGNLGSNLATYSYLNQMGKAQTPTVPATGNT